MIKCTLNDKYHNTNTHGSLACRTVTMFTTILYHCCKSTKPTDLDLSVFQTVLLQKTLIIILVSDPSQTTQSRTGTTQPIGQAPSQTTPSATCLIISTLYISLLLS